MGCKQKDPRSAHVPALSKAEILLAGDLSTHPHTHTLTCALMDVGCIWMWDIEALDGNIFFTGLFLLLLHSVPGARMTTLRAQGPCNGNGVTKEPENSRKHLIQMFHCRMEE